MKRLFVILLFCLCAKYFAQTEFYNVEHLVVDKGLSQNSVLSIFQDSKELMWFGTDDGLNKFDGYSYTIYRREVNNPKSIGNNSILCITEDSDNNLWIGTLDGLYKYHRNKNVFERIKIPFENSKDKIISSLLYDNVGTIWAGTRSGMVFRINPKDNQYQSYVTVNEYGKIVFNSGINNIIQVDNDEYWVAANATGINKIIPSKRKIERYIPIIEENGKELLNTEILSMIKLTDGNIAISTVENLIYSCDSKLKVCKLLFKALPTDNVGAFIRCIGQNKNKKDEIWFGTEGTGLFQYNFKTKQLFPYNHTNSIIERIANFKTIYFDKYGMLWLGTNGTGIYHLSPDVKNFYTILQSRNSNKGLPFSSLRAIFQTDLGTLWVGGYGGLALINKDNLESKLYSKIYSGDITKNKFYDFLPSFYVYSITPDFYNPERYFWVCTEGQGFYKVDYLNQKFEMIHFPVDSANVRSDLMQCYNLKFGKDGTLYLGTYYGLAIISRDYKKMEIFHYSQDNPDGIQSGGIRNLLFDKDGVLWLGSDMDGLSYFDKKNKKFVKYKTDPNNSNSLSSNRITAIHEDQNGFLWIGTWGGGLNKLNKKTGKVKVYTSNNGLPNNVVYAILDDGNNNLWVSTNIGLSRFNIASETFTNYNAADGLQGNEFNRNASFKGVDGLLYFGGINGLTYFNPRGLKKNSVIPSVVLTSFKVFNKEKKLDYDFAFVKEININPDETLFSLEFAALNYYQTNKNMYKYKLIGFNDNWIELGNKRDVTFTNLAPGQYVLEVIAANNDGVWNTHGLTLKINVLTPFYKSWGFIFVVIIIVLSSIWVIVNVQINNSKKHKEELEELINQKTYELTESNKRLLNEVENNKVVLEKYEKVSKSAEAANKAKSLFLANMSHELRTPLNAVLGFSELLKNNLDDEKLLGYVKSIDVSGKILLNLISDIIDLSKIEAGTLKLVTVPISIDDIVTDLNLLFIPKAKEKKLQYETIIDNELPKILNLDADRIKQVLVNLIDNAIKFTKTGKVSVVIKKGKINLDTNLVDIIFKVSDTGIGIADEIKDKIFENFYQLDSESTRSYGGTGLGLPITKKLIDMMNGNLKLESKLNVGSSFCFTIPNVLFERKITAEFGNKKEEQADFVKFNWQTVLIVDDAEINRKLIRAYLNQFNLVSIEAADGEEAINVMREQNPELVLMDLKMPKMNGSDACKIIKADEKLKWTPIIALTAAVASETEQLIEESGFNGYLQKPIGKTILVNELIKHLKYNVAGINKNSNSIALSVDKWSSINFSENEVTEYSLVLFTLKTKYLSKIPTLKSTFIINNIEQFANDIVSIGEKNNLSVFIQWGNELLQACQNVDMEQIIDLLSDFNNLVEGFEKKLSR